MLHPFGRLATDAWARDWGHAAAIYLSDWFENYSKAATVLRGCHSRLFASGIAINEEVLFVEAWQDKFHGNPASWINLPVALAWEKEQHN